MDVYALTSVTVCDGWALARQGDQWLGWTPAPEAGTGTGTDAGAGTGAD